MQKKAKKTTAKKSPVQAKKNVAKANPKTVKAKAVITPKVVAAKRPSLKEKASATAQKKITRLPLKKKKTVVSAVSGALPRKTTTKPVAKVKAKVAKVATKPVKRTAPVQQVSTQKNIVKRKVSAANKDVYKSKPVVRVSSVKLIAAVRKRRKARPVVNEKQKNKIPKTTVTPAIVWRGTRIAQNGPKYFFSTDIPEQYGETYLCALPRDPLWIFVYWEITQAALNSLMSKIGIDNTSRAKAIVRVLDVTDVTYDGSNAWRTMDFEVMLNAGSTYVKVWDSGRTYLVVLGMLTAQGGFFEIVRSNCVVTPRMGISAVTDEEWLTSASDEILRVSTQSLRRCVGASERLDDFSLDIGSNLPLNLPLNAGSGSGAIL